MNLCSLIVFRDDPFVIKQYSNCSFQYAIFEPGTRNTGTSIAGKNIANPIAILNSAVDMLHHLGHNTHADIIENAINKTVNEDKIHTPG